MKNPHETFMASTGLLRLTIFIQILNIIVLPILGLVIAVAITVILEAFTFGNADDAYVKQLSGMFLIIFLALALFYLIDTIGLASKSNIFRFLSIVVNFAVAAFIGYGLATGGFQDQLIVGGVLILIYLIPVATLTIHKPTVDLFT